MMSGSSSRHGLHQDAQKFRSTGRPRYWERVTIPRDSVVSVKSGAGVVCAAAGAAARITAKAGDDSWKQRFIEVGCCNILPGTQGVKAAYLQRRPVMFPLRLELFHELDEAQI